MNVPEVLAPVPLPADGFVRCAVSHVTVARRHINEGDIVPVGDPAVQANPHLFLTLDATPIEKARAVNSRRRARKAAEDAAAETAVEGDDGDPEVPAELQALLDQGTALAAFAAVVAATTITGPSDESPANPAFAAGESLPVPVHKPDDGSGIVDVADADQNPGADLLSQDGD